MFERDMLEIGKQPVIPGIENDKADVQALVKLQLHNSATGRWLSILDNADDEALCEKRSDPMCPKPILAE
jgi:hypothetical protein